MERRPGEDGWFLDAHPQSVLDLCVAHKDLTSAFDFVGLLPTSRRLIYQLLKACAELGDYQRCQPETPPLLSTDAAPSGVCVFGSCPSTSGHTRLGARCNFEPPGIMVIVLGDWYDYSLVEDDPPSQHGLSSSERPRQYLPVTGHKLGQSGVSSRRPINEATRHGAGKLLYAPGGCAVFARAPPPPSMQHCELSFNQLLR